MEPYAKNDGAMGITRFIGDQLNGSLDWDYLAEIRWEGEIYLKGVLHGQDATGLLSLELTGLQFQITEDASLMLRHHLWHNFRPFVPPLARMCH